MIDFSTVKAITIPEGNAKKITAGGAVIWEKEESGIVLPEGYTQVEYIQSAGTQYIDTGYDPIVDTIIEIGYEYTSISSSTYYYVFGNYNSAGKATCRLMTNTSQAVVNMYSGADTVNFNTTAKVKNTRYDDILSHTTYITNGTTYDMGDKANGSSNSRNLALFANYVGGRETSMKLYYCRIKEETTLIRNYIPCLDADGVACLYDTVTQQTYYNAGTGKFEYAVAA